MYPQAFLGGRVYSHQCHRYVYSVIVFISPQIVLRPPLVTRARPPPRGAAGGRLRARVLLVVNHTILLYHRQKTAKVHFITTYNNIWQQRTSSIRLYHLVASIQIYDHLCRQKNTTKWPLIRLIIGGEVLLILPKLTFIARIRPEFKRPIFPDVL